MDSSIRLLYVDEEPGFSDSTMETLRAALGRVRVETASTASAGLERLDDVAVDCVVSGYELPGTDGIEFLETVREERGNLPFVLLVDETSAADPRRAIDTGVTVMVRTGHPDWDQLLAHRIGIALEQSPEPDRFRLLAESAMDAIITIDADSEIRFANGAVEEMFGYAAAELVGEPLPKLMPERHRDSHREAVSRYLATGERSIDWSEIPLTGLRKTGEEIDLSVSFGAFEQNGEVRFLGIIRDVTERIKQQEELERQNDRLNEFANIVSHDLRNPLSVAAGRLELAQTECESEHLPAAETAIQRSQAHIEDLLTLAREGDRATDIERLDLAELAESCWENVPTGGATLTVETGATLDADRGRLERLLENLYRNSVEHGSTGNPTESGDAVEHGGEAVTVTVGDLENGFFVADDGVGIPEAERDDVFKPGHTTSEDGTGYGLSIAEQVANAHDWSISVSESSDGGARFEITGIDGP